MHRVLPSPAGGWNPGSANSISGSLSVTMWASSFSPTLGMIGTTAAPAHSAPTTAAQVSRLDVAHTATRLAEPTRRAIPAATAASSR